MRVIDPRASNPWSIRSLQGSSIIKSDPKAMVISSRANALALRRSREESMFHLVPSLLSAGACRSCDDPRQNSRVIASGAQTGSKPDLVP